MQYTLIHVDTRQQLASGRTITALWQILDVFSHSKTPVVITDENDEIRAGNLLGMAKTIDKGQFWMEAAQ